MTDHIYLNSRTSAFLIADEPIYIRNLTIDVIKLNKKRALLKQPLMPGQSNFLLNFPDNARIDLIYKYAGKFSDYDENETVIRLTNCKLRLNWIPNPVGNLADQDELKVCALISCNVEVINERI